MPDYPKSVVIEEQGLRDGLQNEDLFVPTEKKIGITNALIEAGIKRIQVTSFVNPKTIPQMADADKLYAELPRTNEVVYSALVLNPKGMERATRAGVTHVTASISASDTHSQRNAGMSLEGARKQFAEMVAIGKSHALTIRGGLQCVFGCRYEGRIDPGTVMDMLKEQLDLGNRSAKDWLGYALKRLQTESAKRLAEEAMNTTYTDWWFEKKSDWWVNGNRDDENNPV